MIYNYLRSMGNTYDVWGKISVGIEMLEFLVRRFLDNIFLEKFIVFFFVRKSIGELIGYSRKNEGY